MQLTLIHLLQKQLTAGELNQLTAYLLLDRFKKVSDLKQLFKGPHDFLYLLVSDQFNQLNFPFDKRAWQSLSKQALLAQALDASTEALLQKYENTHPQLETIAQNPLTERSHAVLAQARQLSIALSHRLVDIKTAQAQTKKPFQNNQDAVIALLLPLYHQYSRIMPAQPKLALKFLTDLLEAGIPEFALRPLADALAKQYRTFIPVPLDSQIKATFNILKGQIRPLHQRLSRCVYICRQLATAFPQGNETARSLLAQAKALQRALRTPSFSLHHLEKHLMTMHYQIDSCMQQIINQESKHQRPLHWLILNTANQPSLQKKCIEILLEEGADPRLEINRYPRTRSQKWKDFRTEGVKSIWVAPLRNAEQLAQLMGLHDIAQLFQKSQPEMTQFSEVEIETAKDFLPAFGSSLQVAQILEKYKPSITPEDFSRLQALTHQRLRS